MSGALPGQPTKNVDNHFVGINEMVAKNKRTMREVGKVTELKCTKCGEIKPASEFSTMKYKGALVYRWACKKCINESKRAWRHGIPKDKRECQKCVHFSQLRSKCKIKGVLNAKKCEDYDEVIGENYIIHI